MELFVLLSYISALTVRMYDIHLHRTRRQYITPVGSDVLNQELCVGSPSGLLTLSLLDNTELISRVAPQS
jgi:hypothetical protein